MSSLLMIGVVVVVVVTTLVVVARPYVRGGARVLVVGAGEALGALGDAQAPAGARYHLEVVDDESIEATERRVDEAIGAWPPVLVLGLSSRQLGGGPAAEDKAVGALGRFVARAENALAVPLVIGFVAPPGSPSSTLAAVARANLALRDRVCSRPGLRLCTDVSAHGASPASLQAAIAAGVVDALARERTMRASTQTSR